MKSDRILKEYLEFFKKKGHKLIINSSLIPENDPTVLFTTAGMHPLVPYLLGQKHPLGNRLVSNQKCLRTDDIEEVGDTTHLTWFEMIGNWSLGDYFKDEAIKLSYEFLTKNLKINPDNLHITIFKGDKDAPKDATSEETWKSLGIPKERIYYFGKTENWWGPAGTTGPCGPDTEMFYDIGKRKCSKKCDPSCNCGKYIEIWNDVFMEYNKQPNGKFTSLKQKNVDTGFGLERAAMILQNKQTIFETDLFLPIIKKIKNLSKKENETSLRILTDHLRASTFLLSEEIQPSNVEQGYILRRLIRRSIRHARLLEIQDPLTKIIKVIINTYKKRYPLLQKKINVILEEFEREQDKFENTLTKGLSTFEKEIKNIKKIIPGRLAFILFTSYGFPIEMVEELAKEKKLTVDKKGFEKKFKKHQEISRKGAEKKFRSGLSDTSQNTKKLHTATHLLQQALREVLGNHVKQMGSNITPDRLRFDFSNPRPLTKGEIEKVENIVNNKIKENLKVKTETLPYTQAIKKGALAFFKDKYPKKVTVYSIGNYSKEVCTGPHVDSTKEIGKFKIVKEESTGAGIRRIKAIIN